MLHVRAAATLLLTLTLPGVPGLVAAQETAGLGPFDPAPLLAPADVIPAVRHQRAFPALRFTRPLLVTHAGDGSGRLFVGSQQGQVYVFPNRDDVKEAGLFLDLGDVTRRQGNEEGLLGVAFHPNYRENGLFFVDYSATPRQSVISRFRVSKEDPNRADRASEEKVLTVPQPFENHNGGTIEFGPDGMLYVALGDGGAAADPFGNGQKLNTLLAKILRIDVDRKDPGLSYAVPPDNPFAGKEGARGEIWAYGLRNVWRHAFDRLTGALWAGDVGQDRFEEVDLIVRGGNYGWNRREGLHPFGRRGAPAGPEFIEPVIEYPRADGASVTGGVVYRGAKIPALQGAYLYADYESGNLWALRWNGAKVAAHRKLAATRLNVSSFGQDEEGEVYFTAFDGAVYRLMAGEEAAPAGEPALFPRRLSQTGLFARAKDGRLQPAPALIPYEVNLPAASGGAVAERGLALPAGGKMTFREGGGWEFPTGAVLAQTLGVPSKKGAASPGQPVETRLLVRRPDGWTAYSYLWPAAPAPKAGRNAGGTSLDEAYLLDGAAERQVETASGAADGEPVVKRWEAPSRADCGACHAPAAAPLGWNARQLNRPRVYGAARDPENQLKWLARAGLFSAPLPESATQVAGFPPPPDDAKSLSGEPLARSARAFLDVNCAPCHQGAGPGGLTMDLRFETPLDRTATVNAAPKAGPGDGGGRAIIAPGDARGSLLLRRMADGGRPHMPPMGTGEPDPRALALIARWIDSLPPSAASAPPAGEGKEEGF
ncbi:MAG: PQQ-dependent sugar dehydrogenase [Planctomycetes bacterium]|nr:PQQ-dependent sugar dehydrogenase [Planctomycetota bacterium]